MCCTIINKHIILVAHDNGDANTGYYCLCYVFIIIINICYSYDSPLLQDPSYCKANYGTTYYKEVTSVDGLYYIVQFVHGHMSQRIGIHKMGGLTS